MVHFHLESPFTRKGASYWEGVKEGSMVLRPLVLKIPFEPVLM
jgi:hypothetical protein